jgi:hypothetical protein
MHSNAITCDRCGVIAKDPCSILEAGWALPILGGHLCPACYEGLCAVRSRADYVKQAAIAAYYRGIDSETVINTYLL